MIFTRYGGRLGNNLFQFAFSATLSKLSGVPFAAKPIRGFPGTANQTSERSFRDGIKLQGQACNLNLGLLATLAETTDVAIDCHPQAIHYYEPHKSWLCQLLAPEEGYYERVQKGDIALHLRLGDFFHSKKSNSKYPVEGIHHLLRNTDFDTCVVVTNSPTHPLVKSLKSEFRCVILSGRRMDDYRTLYHAERLIISPSTFSWWAAWSGRATQVFCPFDIGYWKTQKNSLMLRGPEIQYWNGAGLLNSVPLRETPS